MSRVKKDYNIKISIEELEYRTQKYGSHLDSVGNIYEFCVYKHIRRDNGLPLRGWEYFVVGPGCLAGRFGRARTKCGAIRKAVKMINMAWKNVPYRWQDQKPVMVPVLKPRINTPGVVILSSWYPKNWIEG